MQALLPDPFTAFGMTAMAGATVAWLMWVLGRAYWHKGLSAAIASALLYALACACSALQIYQPHIAWQLLAALALNAAIAAITWAIQRFRHSLHPRRDVATVVLPMAATLLLHAWFFQEQSVWLSVLQSSIYAVQILFVLGILLRMRSDTPGSGWQWLSVALSVQWAAHLLAILHMLDTTDAAPPALPSAGCSTSYPWGHW